MKSKKVNSQQLSLDFDNPIEKGNKTFQINHQASYSQNSITSNCKVISFDSFNQSRNIELLNRFYSLSNHLD